MEYQKFSPRQLMTLSWWNKPGYNGYDAIICDGSIRSGKTISMAVGFVLWSMCTFDDTPFAICGKTIESLRRNVVLYFSQWLEGVFTVTERRSENLLIISGGGHTNRYFLFGGRDESSYSLIQGMTLAGVLFDEVALMPRSFVEQAMARCSVEGSKFWFNCNPENPNHWFYKEWIIDPEHKKNRLYLHFTMDDNFSLSPKVKARYEGMYSGVFYSRYICGEWVVAEGLVYTMFDKAFHVAPTEPRPYERYIISCDYGTINPTSMGLWGLANGKWYRMREYYFDSRKEHFQKTDEEHYTALEELVGSTPLETVIVDPSAASFIECVRRHGRFRVDSANNAVLNGIREVATYLRSGKLFFNDCCVDCIREFGLYRWDEKASEDKVLKENDHAMDDVRYFVREISAKPTFSFQ